jgi:phosphoglycerate dehydrogenase-like enzyme
MTMLTQNHFYNKLYEHQKERDWRRWDDVGGVKDYAGQRLGVLGYGSIGRQAAHVAKALGMDVIAYTASPKDTPEKRKDVGFIVPGTGDPDGVIPRKWYSGTDKDSLHTFLKQDIDVLLISVPLTKDTRHMLSTAEFDILSKRKALISNIARGGVIDQPALVTALQDGKLRGAALDVADPEPLPKDDPLWAAPNVTITPHISGNGVDYNDRAFQVLEVNLGKRANGEPLINVIDREKGY